MKTKKRIETLITELRSEGGLQRKRAREVLVEIGKPAVSFLIDLMNDPDEHVRWEACKALVSISDATAAVPLVIALRDKSSGVRWLAAKALIAIKNEAVAPLLQALQEHFDSPDLRQGAHHVLDALKKQKLLNRDTLAVLDNLNLSEPNSTVAWAAHKGLENFNR